MKLFANRYSFWVHQYNVASQFPFGGVLSLCPQLEAPIVTAATCTVPIQITTDRLHGLANGSQVFIDGAQGNTAANGLWFATVVDAYSYTLNNSDGTGMPDYVANSARAANTLNQLARCILWYAAGGSPSSPRSGRTDGLFVGLGCYYLNQSMILSTGSAQLCVLELFDPSLKAHTWWGQRACISEPLISAPGVAAYGGKQENLGGWHGTLSSRER